MPLEESRAFLLIMTLVHLVNDGFEMVVPTLLPVIAMSLALNYSEIGLVSGAMVLAMGLGQSFVGAGSDYFGHKKRLVILGVLLSSCGLCLMSFSSTLPTLLASSLLIGFGLSVYHPVGMALITNKFKSNPGKAVGIHGAGGNAGMFLFPLVAGILADAIGWRKTLIVFPMVGFLVIFLYAVFIREDKIKLGSFEPKKLMIPVLAIIIISIGFFNAASRGFFTFFPVALGDIGYSSSSIGIYFSLFFGVGIIGQYLGGLLCDNFNKALTLFCLLIIAGISMYLSLNFPRSPLLLLNVVIAGISVNMIWPIFFVLYAQRTPPELRSTGFGVFFSVNYLFAASSPVIMGHMATWYSRSISNYFVPFTSAIAAIVIISISRNNR